MKIQFQIEEPNDMGRLLEFVLAHLSGVRGEPYTVAPQSFVDNLQAAQESVAQRYEVTDVDEVVRSMQGHIPVADSEDEAQLSLLEEPVMDTSNLAALFGEEVKRLGVPRVVEALKKRNVQRFSELMEIEQVEIVLELSKVDA